MTGRHGAAGDRPGGGELRAFWVGGGRRVATLVLVGLLLFGTATLIGYARLLNEAARVARDAQSDNFTWTVSQLEVDLAHFRLALAEAEAGMVPGGGTAGSGTAGSGTGAVNRTFDIFYNRVNLIYVQAPAFDPARDAGTLVLLAQIRARTQAMAALADQGGEIAPPALLAEMRSRAEALEPAVRDFALGGLNASVREAANARESHRALLQRFSTLAIVLVVLLSGAIWLTVDMYRDLLGRARAIRRVSSNLSRTIEASLDAVIITDGQGRIREYNRAAETIFGQPRDIALGRDIAGLLLPPPEPGESRCGIAPFLAAGAGGQDRAVLTAAHRDGRRFPLEAAVVSDRDSEGQPIHIAFLRDITDRLAVESALREARDAAEKSATARARFLAVMSHEMRTPLHGVVAALDLMARGTLDEAQRRLVRIAQTSGQNALEQVEDLLDLARRDDHAAETPVAFDPVALCAEIAENARPLAAERGNRILLDLPKRGGPKGDGPGRVLGLRRAFVAAVGNLMGNAVKFTEGGRITLTLRHGRAEDGAVLLDLAVADEGVGIAPEDQKRIFEDFETLDSSLTRAEGGTGLGLGIARRAVTALGGRIELESAPGAGSTFRFSVRMQPAPEAVEAPGTVAEAVEAGTTPPAGPGRRLAVLVADDNPINLLLMQEMLVRLGHEAVAVADGAGAVAAAAERGFDAILMDVSMPGMDGLEATARIRAGGPSAASPVIAVTAHSLPEDVAQIRAAGIAEVLTKPIRLDVLERALSALAPNGPQGTRPSGGPAAPVNGAEDPLLDPEVVADACALLSPARRVAAIDAFEAEYAAARAAIGSGAGNGSANGATAADRLHRLAGGAAVLGAFRLSRRLSEAEAQAGQGGPGFVRALTQADAALAETVAALRRQGMSRISDDVC